MATLYDLLVRADRIKARRTRFWCRMRTLGENALVVLIAVGVATLVLLGFLALTGCYDPCDTRQEHPSKTRSAECGADPAGRHLPAFGQKGCGPAASLQPARAAEAAAILPANPPAQSAVTAPHSALRVSHSIWRVTAYCPCRLCCGPRASGITASGSRADHPLVAGPPDVPYGTYVTVPGYDGGRAVRVEDRGGAIRGRRLDILFPIHAEALAWGVRFLAVRFTAETAEK